MPPSLIQYLWHQSRTYSLCPATRSRTNRITPLCSPIMLCRVQCAIGAALYTDICRRIGPHSLSHSFRFLLSLNFCIAHSAHSDTVQFVPLTINECVKRDFHSSTHHIINIIVSMVNAILLAHRWQTPKLNSGYNKSNARTFHNVGKE